MIHRSTRHFAVACLISLAASGVCTPAIAQDDEPKMVDARLEGYGTRDKPVVVALQQGNTSLTWVLLVILGSMAVGVMFKHAKRSHLD